MKDLISRLTLIDCIALLAVLRGLYVGYKSGLFPELLRIFSYLVTAIVTFRFYDSLTQLLTLNTFLNEFTSKTVAVTSLIVVTFLVCKLFTMMLLKLLKVGEGNFLNKLFGALFGACRWVILLSLFFMLTEHLPFEPLKADIKTRSLTGPFIARIAPLTFEYLSTLSPQLAVTRK